MAVQKNKIYRAEIVDYTAEGSGVARIEGMAVFVPNTAVGDQCDIRIVKVNKRMAFAAWSASSSRRATASSRPARSQGSAEAAAISIFLMKLSYGQNSKR